MFVVYFLKQAGDMLTDLEKLVLNRYIRNKSVKVSRILRDGMLSGNIDRGTEEIPNDIDKYVLEGIKMAGKRLKQ